MKPVLFGIVTASVLVLMTACAFNSSMPSRTPAAAVEAWAADYDPTAETTSVLIVGNPVQLAPAVLCYRVELTRTWLDSSGEENHISAKRREPIDLLFTKHGTTATLANSELPDCTSSALEGTK